MLTLAVTPKKLTQLLKSQWVHVKDLMRKSHANFAIIKFQANKLKIKVSKFDFIFVVIHLTILKDKLD